MTFNNAEAQNEIRKLFNDRFTDYCTNGFGDVPPLNLKKRGSNNVYVPKIFWQNIEKVDLSDSGEHWLRFYLTNVLKRQKSLTGGREQAVGTHYNTRGMVKVELYFSKTAFQSVDIDRLNLIVERCFVQENTNCGVWFRNAIIVDLNPEETHFRSNVLAEYEYDSVIN